MYEFVGQVENDASRNTDDESERFRTATRSAQASVSGCARVKVYSPGARVFAQGRSYIHTYCTYIHNLLYIHTYTYTYVYYTLYCHFEYIIFN